MSIRRNDKRKKKPWEFRWFEDGVHHSRSFHLRKEAEQYEHQRKSLLKDGSGFRTKDEKITLDDYANKYLSRKKRPSTVLRNIDIYKRHIQPTFGAVPIRQIRHSDVQKIVYLWEDKGLSSRTILRQLSVLSAVFTLAYNDGVINRNPAKGISRQDEDEPHRYAMTVEEVLKLRACIHPNYEAFIYTLVETGMRISEAISLNIGDFDWAEGLLKITASKTKAGIRIMRISSTAMALISIHLKSTGRTMVNSTEPLFVSHKTDSSGTVIGNRINYSNFRNRIFKPAAIAIGLPDLQAHDFRRTSATILVNENAPPKVTQERMGHDDYRTTNNLYAQGTEKAHRDVVEMMERVLNPVPVEKEKEA